MEESRISTCVCGDQEIMCIWTKKLISVCVCGGGDQEKFIHVYVGTKKLISVCVWGPRN